MLSRSSIAAALLLAGIACAHGDHTFDLNDDDTLSYAEKHMQTEHHIDSFDLPSFFKLHDLDMDGFWDKDEIAAVYGLHHHSVKDHIPHEESKEERTEMIVNKVMERLDTDKDGKVSLAEFEAGGKEGLPRFIGYKGLGHHYDEESEYFLHHEELYHSTPETQTEESYTHPEDIEHFRHHQHIEEEEDARERIFEGLSPEADLMKDHVTEDPLDIHAHAEGEGPSEDRSLRDQQQRVHVFKDGENVVIHHSQHDSEGNELHPGDEVSPPPPRIERANPGAQPNRIQRVGASGGGTSKAQLNAAKENAERLGPYDIHGRPRSSEERLRPGTPYKYKMRKGLRADEF